jgi:hypothetical protein
MAPGDELRGVGEAQAGVGREIRADEEVGASPGRAHVLLDEEIDRLIRDREARPELGRALGGTPAALDGDHDVGGHGAIGHGQIVEAPRREDMERKGAEEGKDVLAFNEAAIQVQLPAVQAEVDGEALVLGIEVAIRRCVPALHEITAPVEAAHDGFHAIGRVARRVQAAHEGAHARPEDHVDGNTGAA